MLADDDVASSRDVAIMKASESSLHWVPLRALPQQTIRDGIGEHKKRRPWLGPAKAGDPVVFIVGLAPNIDSRTEPIHCGLFPYTWPTNFGAVTSLTFFSSSGTLGRIFIDVASPELARFVETGRAYFVFVRGERPVWAAEIQLSAENSYAF